jgi:heptaprenyl diphosphate synthase
LIIFLRKIRKCTIFGGGTKAPPYGKNRPINENLKGGDGILKTRKLVTLALLDAIALTIFMIEAQIPALVPIPGIKLGLSNIITVFTVFAIGPWEGAAVLFVRIFLGAVFAGNFSTILYSGAGGLCAILVTMGLRKLLTKKQLRVAGCLGAVAHSAGQMAMAICITGTPAIAVYLPVMVACSIITGLFTGLCAQVLVNRRGNLWKITSK